MDDATRELLAAYAHEAWSGWMEYLFSRSYTNDDGSVTIPDDLVARWGRQMDTPYAELPENERDSDRAEADKMLAIIAAAQGVVCPRCGDPISCPCGLGIGT